jgi:hypothetical protein
MNQEDLLSVAGFPSEPEAQIAQAMLAEHGINASIDNGESALGFDLVDMDEIDLIVMRQDFDRAKVLIEEMEALQNEEQEPVPAWTCQCGEEVDEGFFVCWSCGADYEPAAK